MIELVIAFAGIVALLAMKAQVTPVLARQFLYEWLGICFCLILIGSVMVYYQSYYGTVVTHAGPASGTMYVNANYTSITVYATTNSILRAWIGNSTALLMAVNDTATLASGIGVTDLPGSVTSTLVVPEGDYYQYNYTEANFTLVEVRT